MQRGKTAASRLWPITALLACGCSGGTTMVGDGGEDAWIQDPGEDVRIDDGYDPGTDDEPEAAVPRWSKTYGGSDIDLRASVQQTSDGGYVAAGYTSSFGAGGTNGWLLKLDGSGDIQWQKIFGAMGPDTAERIEQTADGGYIVTGSCGSCGTRTGDLWVMKLGSDGTIADDCPEGMGRDSSAVAALLPSIPVATTAIPRDTACFAVDAIVREARLAA